MAQTLDELARSQIKLWITSTGITQTALGERIGRNQAWMSRYLSGELDADLETLQKMAAVFGHVLTSLLNVPGDPEEAALVKLYRAIGVERRKLVLALLHDWNPPPRRRGPKR